MNQQFFKNIISFWKFQKRYEFPILIFIALLIFCFLINLPLTKGDEISLLLSNILQFSGIFSALLITYIIARVDRISKERFGKRKEIIELYNKTTNFRRIALVLKNCTGFWNSAMIKNIDVKFQKLNYFDVHLWDYTKESKNPTLTKLRDEFFKIGNSPDANLYLDLKSLTLEDPRISRHELYNSYDYNIIYPLEILKKWSEAYSGSNLSYCFRDKWDENLELFNFHAIGRDNEQKILDYCRKIDPTKYAKSTFDKDLLVKISDDFCLFILPKLHKQTILNTRGLPETLKFILKILYITVIFGVLLPLILSSIAINSNFLLISTYLAVSVLCTSILYFLFKFWKILNSEIMIG